MHPRSSRSEKKIDPQQARIEELERLAGKLSLELEITKKALTLLPQTKPPARVEPEDERTIPESSGVPSAGCVSQQSVSPIQYRTR